MNFSLISLSLTTNTKWAEHHVETRILTAPNATESMVCIRASSMELSTPFLLSSALPASVQNRTCFIPTDTKWVSESGRNSATKILWVWPARLATLAPLKINSDHKPDIKAVWRVNAVCVCVCVCVLTSTFLPLPDGEGVLGVQTHRKQQFASGAEAYRANAPRMMAAQHREGLFVHGFPHMDRRRCGCKYKNTLFSSVV